MLSASLYIIVCSARNRIRRRLRRLREPRYLLGALVGAAYLYFTFFARSRGRAAADAARRRNAGRRGSRVPDASVFAAVVAVGPAIGGFLLLVGAVAAWALPFESGLLEFSEAEIDWLFTAPVTRRQLLMHRLLRSQLGILFGSLIVAFASQTAGGSTRLRISIATWVAFVTIRVYFTAVSLVRSRLRSSLTAWMPVAALIAALAIAVVPLAHALLSSPVVSVVDAFQRIAAVSTRRTLRVVLWPFAAVVAPFFASTPDAFVRALAASLVVLAVAILWMLRSDETFQDVAAEAATRRIVRRAGGRGPAFGARSTGLRLALTGAPETALWWKNGVQTLRLTGVAAIRIGVALTAVIVGSTSLLMNAFRLRGGAAAACAVAIGLAAFNAILGPQVVRTDLRTDLLHLDVLKTWPIRAAAVIRGEIAWPATLLTLVGWAAVACGAAFSTAAFPGVPLGIRAATAIAAALVTPALVSAQYLVQNAAALSFPAWVPLGGQRPRGVDAMGQRLIMLVGVLAAVILLMLPGVIAGGLLWLALQRWLGFGGVVPAAALCTAVVLLEVLIGSELLGPLYERLDILAVERAE